MSYESNLDRRVRFEEAQRLTEHLRHEQKEGKQEYVWHWWGGGELIS